MLTLHLLCKIYFVRGLQLGSGRKKKYLLDGGFQANNVGAPRGSALKEPAPAASGSSAEATASSPASSSSGTPSAGELEGRMKKLEENLALQHKHGVDDALKNVRTLASRPKLTSPGVLIASLEVLVDCASASGHPEKEFYQKALTACRQHEEHPDLCGLCLKLIGSSDDKKIANSVAEWVKACRKSDNVTVKENKEEPPKSPSSSYGYIPHGYPAPYPPPFYPYGSPVLPPFGPSTFSPGRRGRPQGPSMGGKKKLGPCFYCKELGHLVNDCPKIKKE